MDAESTEAAMVAYLQRNGTGTDVRRVFASSDLEAALLFATEVKREVLAFLGLDTEPDGIFEIGIKPEAEFFAERGQPGRAAHVVNLPGNDAACEPFILDPGGCRLFRVRADSREGAGERFLSTMRARFDGGGEFMPEPEFIAKHGAPAHVIDVGAVPDGVAVNMQ